MEYAHVIQFVRDEVWAILPAKLALMVDVLRFRSAGGRLSSEEIIARVGEEARKRSEPLAFDIEAQSYMAAAGGQAGRGGTVAVVPVYGLISQRASMVDDISGPGGTSTERLGARLRSVMNDASVKAVVLDVDSPGGGVSGVSELADEIRSMRGTKPLVAVCNSLAASAAYWIASACDEVVCTPGGEVGSVGVYAAHEDVSAALATEGVKITLISAGKYKTEANPFEPLTDDAKAYIQGRVDEFAGMFERSVAKGRGVSVEDVRNNFGQGRTVGAKDAVTRKMADRVDTLDATVRRLGARPAASVMSAAVEDAPATVAEQTGPSPVALAEIEAAKLRARTL